ncbi:MAG: GNAT family N-acetyltransferase [Capsulimonadales bacterium]|nr:GNAT family N-acetyltransferase [Capsulimonadales bacterium]
MAIFSFLQRPPKRDDILLHGSHLTLRPIRISDAESMFDFATDPEVTRYLPWEADTTLTAVRSWLSEQVQRRQHGHSLAFAIVDRETGVMIGSTDLMDLKVRRGQAELGYLLSRHYWNRGLMSEATTLTVDFAFRELHLQKIYAWVDQANVASRRVLEKLGMECTDSELRFVKGERRSYLHYGLHREDWLKKEKGGTNRLSVG